MKNLITILFLLSAFISYCQKRVPKPQHMSKDKTIDFSDCRETNRFKAAQRNSIYPFSKASKIEVVSFQDIYSYEDDFIPDSIHLKPQLHIIYFSSKYRKDKTNKFISLPFFKEVKIINELQKDSLTHILYNFTFKGKINSIENLKCYEPRNGILFYDKDGNPFEFLEICFSCYGERLSWATWYDRKITKIDWCNEKNTILKEFFKQIGIKYGIGLPFPN